MTISLPATAAALSVVLAALCLLVVPAAGFYLPGVAPNDFEKVPTVLSCGKLYFLPACVDPSRAGSCSGRIWAQHAQIWARAAGCLGDLRAVTGLDCDVASRNVGGARSVCISRSQT